MKFISLEKEKERFMQNFNKVRGRNGTDRLLKDLEGTDFFEAPASTKYHGCFKGGLLFHSNNVAELFYEMKQQHNLDIPTESVMLCGLFHDVCKVGMYPVDENGKIGYVKKNGHALRSIALLSKYVDLTDKEKEIIKYHMGFYGTREFSSWSGEYPIKDLCSGNDEFLTAVFHYADMFASRIYDDNKEDEEECLD